MSLRKKRPQIHAFIAVPVILIILGAFAISAASVVENLRFVRATSQLLWFVGTVRSYAGEQKSLYFNSAEDVWADMVRLGQIPTSTAHTNPWNGNIRVIAVANMAMRIESDLPPQDCRRIALYFLGRQPAELGLLAAEAQSDEDTVWSAIYPPPPAGQTPAAELACGNSKNARLALVFRIR